MTDLIGETIKKNKSAVNSASKTRNWIKTSNKLCESGVFDAYGLKKDWYGRLKTIKMDDDGTVNIEIDIGNGNSVRQYTIKESLIDSVLEIPTKSMVQFSGYFVKGNMSENECLSGGSTASPDMMNEPFQFNYTDVALLLTNRVGKDGKKEGVHLSYYENGQLKWEGNYKDDKQDGEWLHYYESGQLFAKENYKDGKREGEQLVYHSDGYLEISMNYKDGKREGEFLMYHENGQLEIKSNYKDDNAEGEFLKYHRNGQLQFKRNYKDGKHDGEWLSYSENGQLIETFIYKNGEIIEP